MPRDPYLESRVLAADPVELIHILYEHALVQVRSARAALRDGNIAGRSQAISKALAALGELEARSITTLAVPSAKTLPGFTNTCGNGWLDGNLKRDDASAG